jgi:hypothetical protein
LHCPAGHVWPPLADLHAIRAEIERQVMDRLTQIGDGAQTVLVGVRAKDECLARELFGAYGARLELTVGVLPFPPRPIPVQGCGQAGPLLAPPNIRATPQLPEQVSQGDIVRGTVRLANVGPAAVSVDTSSNFVAYLFPPGGNTPVGVPEGGRVGTGLSFDLVPGRPKDVDIYGGTASCEPSLGYVLPAGNYEARALIDWAPPGGGVSMFWSDSVPITVVAP